MKKITSVLLLIMSINCIAICSPATGPVSYSSAADFEVLVSNSLTEVEATIAPPATEVSVDRRYKIYNTNNKLVYECRDANDERLKGLLKRSNLVLTTDSSSYYYLAE